jgi:phenylalanine-4-hydroxylase
MIQQSAFKKTEHLRLTPEIIASDTVSEDFQVDQNWATRYSDKSHATWASLFSSMKELSEKTSCSKLRVGLERARLDATRIPRFEDISKQLSASTNWKIIGANGFIPNEIFFTHLANKRFPMACEIRSLDESQFQEDPDLFHDIYGHTPMLIYPEISNILQSSARAILKALKLGRQDLVKKIATVYWFTIEVGLVKENGEIRVYGAAIASSPKEIMHSTKSPLPNLIKFEVNRVMRTEYNMSDLQRTYFVLDDINDLHALADLDFFECALRLENESTFQEGEICATDEIIQLGTNNQMKRRQA